MKPKAKPETYGLFILAGYILFLAIMAMCNVSCASTSIKDGPFSANSTSKITVKGLEQVRNADGSGTLKAAEIVVDPEKVDESQRKAWEKLGKQVSDLAEQRIPASALEPLVREVPK